MEKRKASHPQKPHATSCHNLMNPYLWPCVHECLFDSVVVLHGESSCSCVVHLLCATCSQTVSQSVMVVHQHQPNVVQHQSSLTATHMKSVPVAGPLQQLPTALARRTRRQLFTNFVRTGVGLHRIYSGEAVKFCKALQAAGVPSPTCRSS